MPTTIIIDGNNMCWRNHYALGPLSFKKKRTEVVYGALRDIVSLPTTLRSYPLYGDDSFEFVFCFDSRKQKRKKLVPTYKNREKKEEYKDVAPQIKELKSILKEIGMKNVFQKKGYEADDLIAQIVRTNPQRKIVVVSSDKDLFQILRSNCNIWLPSKKIIYTEEMFKKEMNIVPGDWIMVKAIAGCSSDTIKGMKGVGEKTAIKYLNAETSEKQTEAIDEYKQSEAFKLNYQLVCLPLTGCPTIKLHQDQGLNLPSLKRVIKENGLHSMILRFNLKGIV